MDYYACVTTADEAQIVRVEMADANPRKIVLARAGCPRDCDGRTAISVHLADGVVRACVTSPSGVTVELQAEVEPGRAGKIGLTAENPTRFYPVEVLASPSAKRVWVQRRSAEERAVAAARERYPQP